MVIILVARLAGAISGGRACDAVGAVVGQDGDDDCDVCDVRGVRVTRGFFGEDLLRISCLLAKIVVQSVLCSLANGREGVLEGIVLEEGGAGVKETVRGCKVAVPRASANGVGAVGEVDKDEFDAYEVVGEE